MDKPTVCSRHTYSLAIFSGPECPQCATTNRIRDDLREKTARITVLEVRLNVQAKAASPSGHAVYLETAATREKLVANVDTIRSLKATIDVHLQTITRQDVRLGLQGETIETQNVRLAARRERFSAEQSVADERAEQSETNKRARLADRRTMPGNEVLVLKARLADSDETITRMVTASKEQSAAIAAAKTENRGLSNLLLSATTRRAGQATEVASLQEAVKWQADVIRGRDGTIKAYLGELRVMAKKIQDLTPECVEGDAVCGWCGGSGSANPQDDRRHQIDCRHCNGSGSAKSWAEESNNAR